jgi:hypothetical protein
MAEACFRINLPSVIFERFEDELVAIHLDKGTYHSMAGSATDAFVLLSEEATSGEIGAALAPFLEQLQTEQLIAPVETRKPRAALRVLGDESGLPFVAPSLQAFRDLEGLLLLDPIHEVGEEGWPPPSEPLAT